MAESPRSLGNWFAGLVVGAASGFLLAALPAVGLFLVIAFAVGAFISQGRLAALGGLLVGASATWLFVIGMATARCAAFDAQPGQECVMADLGPWGLVAAGVLVLGVAASFVAARR